MHPNRRGKILKMEKSRIAILSWASPLMMSLIIAIFILSLFIYLVEPVGSYAEYLTPSLKLTDETAKGLVSLVQNDIYELVISVLVFLNSLIAALSVWYIKTNTEEKAEQNIKKQLKEYLSGAEFEKRLREELEAKAVSYLKSAQSDMENFAKDFAEAASKIYQLQYDQDNSERKLTELSRQMRIIAKAVAEKDTSESDGKNFSFKKEE